MRPNSRVEGDEIERFLAELLSKPNRAEALSWLKGSSEDSSRTLAELGTNAESVDLVERAFEAGAVEVIAVEIETYPDGSQNTGKLVIKLPEDTTARNQVLKWCNELGEQLGLDPETDFGQQYTLVMLD